jgi:hypothetical protein
VLAWIKKNNILNRYIPYTEDLYRVYRGVVLHKEIKDEKRYNH